MHAQQVDAVGGEAADHFVDRQGAAVSAEVHGQDRPADVEWSPGSGVGIVHVALSGAVRGGSEGAVGLPNPAACPTRHLSSIPNRNRSEVTER